MTFAVQSDPVFGHYGHADGAGSQAGDFKTSWAFVDPQVFQRLTRHHGAGGATAVTTGALLADAKLLPRTVLDVGAVV